MIPKVKSWLALWASIDVSSTAQPHQPLANNAADCHRLRFVQNNAGCTGITVRATAEVNMGDSMEGRCGGALLITNIALKMFTVKAEPDYLTASASSDNWDNVQNSQQNI